MGNSPSKPSPPAVPIEIAGIRVQPGEIRDTSLSVGRLFDCTDMAISLRVIHGRQKGPVLFISGAIHGDEIIGTEIIRRLLRHKSLLKLRGTLVAVPVVNVYGYNRLSRYLPDRRDLNRCFPGSAKGSLAARMAYLFFHEVARKCNYGIDFHSAAIHRNNLPQIRCGLEDAKVKRLAKAFNAPVIIDSSLRDGSLRQALVDEGIPALLFEGGQALRHDESAIRLGVKGTLNVMRELKMLPKLVRGAASPAAFVANSSAWVRAPRSGATQPHTRLGHRVKSGQVLASISDPFGDEITEVRAPRTGIVIGQNQLPQVSQGDALFHIATFTNSRNVAEALVDEELELFPGG